MPIYIQALVAPSIKNQLKARLALRGQTIKDWLLSKVQEELALQEGPPEQPPILQGQSADPKVPLEYRELPPGLYHAEIVEVRKRTSANGQGHVYVVVFRDAQGRTAIATFGEAEDRTFGRLGFLYQHADISPRVPLSENMPELIGKRFYIEVAHFVDDATQSEQHSQRWANVYKILCRINDNE